MFDGQAGYLDHALASASLDSQVTGAPEWHINADEPSVLDYDMSLQAGDRSTRSTRRTRTGPRTTTRCWSVSTSTRR